MARTNYRIGGARMDVKGLESVLVILRETVQIDSAATYIGLSMKGYGKPYKLVVNFPSHYMTELYVVNQSIDGSIVYMTWVGMSLGGSVGMGSLGATVSFPVEYWGLIASR